MLGIGIIDDPRVQRLPAQVFRTWINLSLLIQPGELLPDPSELSWRLRVGWGQFCRHLDTLRAHGLIGTNGEGRLRLVPLADVVYQPPLAEGQTETKRTGNAERQRLYRLRKKGIVTLPVTDSVTLPVTDSVTLPVTDSVTLPVTDSVTLPVTAGGRGGIDPNFPEENPQPNCTGSGLESLDPPPTPPQPVTHNANVTSNATVTENPSVTHNVTSNGFVAPAFEKLSDVVSLAKSDKLRTALQDWFQYQVDQRHRRKLPQRAELGAIGREIQTLISVLGEPGLISEIDHAIATGGKYMTRKQITPPLDTGQILVSAQRAYKEANVAALNQGGDLVDPKSFGLTPDGTALLEGG